MFSLFGWCFSFTISSFVPDIFKFFVKCKLENDDIVSGYSMETNHSYKYLWKESAWENNTNYKG